MSFLFTIAIIIEIIASDERKILISQSSQRIWDFLSTISKRCHCPINQEASGDNKIENSEHIKQEIAELPYILQKMTIINFKAEVYSGNSEVQTQNFANCAVNLLSLLLRVLISSSNGPTKSTHMDLPFIQYT